MYHIIYYRMMRTTRTTIWENLNFFETSCQLDVCAFGIQETQVLNHLQQYTNKDAEVSPLGCSLLNRNDLPGPCSSYFVPRVSPQRLLPGHFKKRVR